MRPQPMTPTPRGSSPMVKVEVALVGEVVAARDGLNDARGATKADALVAMRARTATDCIMCVSAARGA